MTSNPVMILNVFQLLGNQVTLYKVIFWHY